MGKNNIQSTVLSSGVTVVTDHFPMGGGLAVDLVVCAGSYHDPLDKNGLAHFAEHMVMHGVPGKSREEFEESLKDKGLLDWNLRTGGQQTRYLAHGSDTAAMLYLDSIVSSLHARSYGPDSLAIECGRIINEQRGNLCNRGRIANQKLLGAMFGDQIHGRWRGGLPEHLERITIEDISSYHLRSHTTGNIILFTSGDLGHDAACRWAETNLATFPVGPRNPLLKSTPRPSDVHLYDQIDAGPEGTAVHAQVIFPTRPLSLTERGAAFIGCRLINRQIRKDVEERMGLYGAGVGRDDLVGDGAVDVANIECSPAEGQKVDTALRKIAEIIYDTISKCPPSDIERERIRELATTRSSEMFNDTSVINRLGKAQAGYFQFGDAATLFDLQKHREALQNEDIPRVLKDLFGQVPSTFYRGAVGNGLPMGAEIAEIIGVSEQPKARPENASLKNNLAPGI